jgi:hypothetical protein
VPTRSLRRSPSAALLAAAACLLPAIVAAQDVPNSDTPRDADAVRHAAAPALAAVRAAAPVRVDGRLDEAAGQAAGVATAFVQRDPDEGAPVSQPTEARLLYDDEALYVGVRLTDTVGVTTRLGRRDMPLLDSDWFAVSIDSYHDHRTAFRFQVNPGGVQRDATVAMGSDGEDDDPSWDPVWAVATSVDADGWTAELRIPFSQLRFRPGAGQTWGLQLERVIGRRGEVAYLSFVPKRELAGVPRYGHLTGLGDVGAGHRAELLPYVAARGEYVDPGANPFRSDREHTMSVGADLRYRVTSNLTLNATVNPDFGQVEVDPAIVNLGVYETFFPERRPFFVEGSEIFDFTGNTSGGSLFYSRRIGRAPQLRPPGARADLPEVTTILGAAKLTGRTAGGWSLGVLDAVTGREEARYLGADDALHAQTAEPLTNYFMARGRRDLRGGRSAVGAALGSVVRDRASPEARDALRSAAWTGGLDFRHEWAQRSWQLAGSVALSHVRGSEAAIVATQRQSNHYLQRPDATHLGVDTATSLTGYSTGLSLTKRAGEHWTGSVAGALTSPRYEANDLGFATRTDRQDLQGVLTYAENQPGRVLRNWSVNAVARHETNYDGRVVQFTTHLGAQARFLDFWSVRGQLTRRARSFDDRSTRGGPAIVRPGERSVSLDVSSDPRRAVTIGLGGSATDGEFGGNALELDGTVSVRTSSRWNLTVGPSFSRGRIAAQYLTQAADAGATATYGRRYVFAPLDYTQLDATIRLNVTFAPRLTLETYAQPLIFASDYGAAGQLRAPHTFAFDPLAAQPEGLDNTLRSLRGNAVLRWEWRPGSTLYVAWQQTRRGFGADGDFDLGRDPRLLFRTAPDNIVMVKATYWLSL